MASRGCAEIANYPQGRQHACECASTVSDGGSDRRQHVNDLNVSGWSLLDLLPLAEVGADLVGMSLRQRQTMHGRLHKLIWRTPMHAAARQMCTKAVAAAAAAAAAIPVPAMVKQPRVQPAASDLLGGRPRCRWGRAQHTRPRAVAAAAEGAETRAPQHLPCQNCHPWCCLLQWALPRRDVALGMPAAAFCCMICLGHDRPLQVSHTYWVQISNLIATGSTGRQNGRQDAGGWVSVMEDVEMQAIAHACKPDELTRQESEADSASMEPEHHAGSTAVLVRVISMLMQEAGGG